MPKEDVIDEEEVDESEEGDEETVEEEPEEEEPGDDDDDEPEPEVVAAPPPKPAPPPPAAAKAKRKRNRTPPAQTPHRERAAHQFRNRDADLLWAEILEALPTIDAPGTTGAKASVYDVGIQVWRTTPQLQHLFTFDGPAAVGDRNISPGEKLLDLVTEYVHLPLPGLAGSVNYEIRFIWRKNTHVISKGTMVLGHPDEIMALRRSKQALSRRAPGASNYTPGLDDDYKYSAPPRDNRDGFGFGGQPPRGSFGSSREERLEYELQREREDKARMQGQLDEIVKALREGRQPNLNPMPQAAPAAATPPPAIDEDRLVAKTIMALRSAGVIGQPQVQTPAAPPQPQPSATERAQNALAEFESLVNVVSRLRSFGQKLDRTFQGEVPDVAAEPTPVVEAPVGNTHFETIPEAKWDNGTPVNIARDKKTGDIDWVAAAFANPAVVQPAVEKLSGALADFMSVVARKVPKQEEGAAERVNHIPSTARDVGQAQHSPANGSAQAWPEI